MKKLCQATKTFRFKSTKIGVIIGSFIIVGLMISNCSNSHKNTELQVVEEDSTQQETVIEPPDSLKLDSFYRKYLDADGIAIVSSEAVPDTALFIAQGIVNYMLMNRPDIREQLIKGKFHVCIMGQSETVTDLPEYRDMEKPSKEDGRLTVDEIRDYDKPGGIGNMTAKQYWNERVRGMGGSSEVSCAEENLLGYKDDGYYGENIFVHEFSHSMMFALQIVDPDLYAEIGQAYQNAKNNGLYKGQYALTTVEEYWAEGTQWWFWSNIEFYDEGTRVQSPEDLKVYDPTLYHILERVYAGHHIPEDVYYEKNLRPAQDSTQ